MQWSFPVTAGSYLVRLYFAEIYFTAAGKRVFDVSIENTLVLDHYDIVADVGAFKGVVKSFVVTADHSLDIQFSRVIENPKVSAIEIVVNNPLPNELGVSPSSVSFPPVPVGTTATQTILLTNLGGAGDPSIVVDATNITGTDAGQFADDFNDAGTVTLHPPRLM